MRTLKDNRGIAPLIVIAVVAVLGLGLFAAKPKFLSGESKRATASTVATAKLEEATNAQGASAAANVTKMLEANGEAPDSPSKTFIGREGPVALAKLPAPDPTELLASERRKVAVMEGQVAQADKLYNQALGVAEQLRKEKESAVLARQKADQDLEIAAAEHLAAERQRNIMVIVAGLGLILFVWVKVTHLSPDALAEAVRDIKTGVNPMGAIDQVTSRFQQDIVEKINKLKSSV